jgi:hypothetical protein
MVAGFVIGRTVTGGTNPATIGWLPKDNDPSSHLFGDRWVAEPLGKIGITIFSSIPHFPAWRCTDCHRVEFTYGDEVVYP